MKPEAERLGERAVRQTQLWQRQAGQGAKKNDKDNICELLINVVTFEKPKTLTGFDQNGKRYGQYAAPSYCVV
mgnify:CR=1 FL=1